MKLWQAPKETGLAPAAAAALAISIAELHQVGICFLVACLECNGSLKASFCFIRFTTLVEEHAKIVKRPRVAFIAGIHGVTVAQFRLFPPMSPVQRQCSTCMPLLPLVVSYSV